MVDHILFCWVGMTDLKAAAREADVGLGPVAQAVAERSYREVVLLNNWEKSTAEHYAEWPGKGLSRG
jgi:hypothetical protein